MTHALQESPNSLDRVAPLFPVAVGLVCGVLVDEVLHPSAAITTAFLGLFSAAALHARVRHRLGPWLVLAAALCAGGLLHWDHARRVPVTSVERFTEGAGRIARLRGVVVSEPRLLEARNGPFARWTFRSEKTVFLFEPETIEGIEGDLPVTGRIRVTVAEAVLDLQEDERVELFGWLYPLRSTYNPGSFDWGAFYRRQGIVARMGCRHRENVTRLDPEPPPHRFRLQRWLRRTARSLLVDDLATGSTEEASLLEAMVLGHRSRLDRRLNEVFINAGCIHFLAVSGTHIVVLLSFVWVLGRLLLRTRRQCAWLMLAAVCVYALIAEPRPPVLRASVMAGLFCLAMLLRRPGARLNWISAAAVVLIVCNAGTLFDVGFQLSFAAVLGVAYLTPALVSAAEALRRFMLHVVLRRPEALFGEAGTDAATRRASRLRGWSGRILRWCLLTLPAVSLGAWAAGAPIVACHFNRVQPWAPLNSVLVFPLMYVVMILGLAKIVVSGLVPPLGPAITAVLGGADGALIKLVEALGLLPGASLTLSAPPWWLVGLYCLFLLCLVRRFRRGDSVATGPSRQPGAARSTVGRRAGGVCVLALALLIVGVVVRYRPGRESDRLVATVLSVGAGLSVVLELPEGQTVLCDAGNRSSYEVGRNTIVPFLRRRGVARLDRVYLSHPNLDHFSGLPGILEVVPAGPIIVNEHFEPRSRARSPARHLLKLLAERGQRVEVADGSVQKWTTGGVTFERLWPDGRLDDTFSSNDTSTVLRLSYAGHSILLTGDVEEAAQRALLRRGDLAADVLVLPHHGGVEPSSGAFVEAVAPQVTIRSSHERMGETFNGLQATVGTTPLYNTADLGAIQVVIDGQGVHMSSTRRGASRPAG